MIEVYLKKKLCYFVFLIGNLFLDYYVGYFLEVFSVSIRNLFVDMNDILVIFLISDMLNLIMYICYIFNVFW